MKTLIRQRATRPAALRSARAPHRKPEPAPEPPPSRPADPARVALTGLFVLSLATFAAGRLAHVPYLALAGALAVLFFGVGTAPLQLSDGLALSVRLGIASVVGLASALLIGSAMVLIPLWYPDVAAILTLLAASAVHARALPSAITELRHWARSHPARRVAYCACGSGAPGR